MIHDDAQTLRDRFRAQWTNGVAVIYANRPTIAISDDAPFVRFSVIPGEADGTRFGGGVIQYQSGRVVGSIFVPRHTGAKQAFIYADEFAAIFRNWDSSNVKLRCGFPLTTVFDDDPDWFQVNVSIPWTSETR